MAEQQNFSRVVFEAHKTVFDEGDKGDSVYMIISGEVEIRKGTNTNNPHILAVLGKGDVFGEMALFDERPRMAAAITRETTEALRISRQEFSTRLKEIDPVMRSMIVYLVNRVRHMSDEFMRRKISRG